MNNSKCGISSCKRSTEPWAQNINVSATHTLCQMNQLTLLKHVSSPGWCSSVDWVWACKPKGSQFEELAGWHQRGGTGYVGLIFLAGGNPVPLSPDPRGCLSEGGEWQGAPWTEELGWGRVPDSGSLASGQRGHCWLGGRAALAWPLLTKLPVVVKPGH